MALHGMHLSAPRSTSRGSAAFAGALVGGTFVASAARADMHAMDGQQHPDSGPCWLLRSARVAASRTAPAANAIFREVTFIFASSYGLIFWKSAGSRVR